MVLGNAPADAYSGMAGTVPPRSGSPHPVKLRDYARNVQFGLGTVFPARNIIENVPLEFE